MAKSRKGGRQRKPGERYACDKLVPVEDKGTPEQRLKREIAAGHRSEASANLIGVALEKVRRANTQLPDEHKLSVRALFEAGYLTDDEYSAVREFNRGLTVQTGTDALDILLGRRIIDRDQFEHALDFTACWCALNGKPWPKGWKAERQAPDHAGGFSESYLKQMKARYSNCLAAMELQDKMIYPMIRDIVVHGKTLGLVEDVVRFDVVRIHGGLIGRRNGILPPSLRYRIGRLTRGVEIIADTPRGDYTKEAVAMIEAIKAREKMSLGTP